jgi:tripartite ATP-independent transporter DctP family solute receptor
MRTTVLTRLIALNVLGTAAFCLQATPADAAKPEFVMKVGTVAPDGTPWAKSVKVLKKRIQKESGGRIKVKIFWSGALGGEKSLVRKTARGQIQAIGVSTGAVATMIPELGVIELPYLFDTLKEADHVLDNPALFDAISKVMADKGFILHLWAENGFRNFATKEKAILSPKDMVGLKMRSQEQYTHTAWYRALGASPVQIPVPEVMQSLQTGVVDGYDNTLLYAFAVSWYQPVKHVTITRHIYQPAVIAYSKKWFDTLPKDLQDILMANRAADTASGRKGVRALTPLLEKNYVKAKKTIHRLTPAQLAEFQKLAPAVHTDFLKKVPAAKPLYKLIQDGKASFKK